MKLIIPKGYNINNKIMVYLYIYISKIIIFRYNNTKRYISFIIINNKHIYEVYIYKSINNLHILVLFIQCNILTLVKITYIMTGISNNISSKYLYIINIYEVFQVLIGNISKIIIILNIIIIKINIIYNIMNNTKRYILIKNIYLYQKDIIFINNLMYNIIIYEVLQINKYKVINSYKYIYLVDWYPGLYIY